ARPRCAIAPPEGRPCGLPFAYPAGGAEGLPLGSLPAPGSPGALPLWFDPTGAGCCPPSAAGGVCCCGGAESSRGGGHGSPRSIACSPGVLIGGFSEGLRSPNSLNTVILGRF